MATSADTAATFCATLVDEWAKAGVSHAMVAPGSRSTPMALALLRDHRIAVHVFHDERSASFAALGVGLSTGVPSVVLCSSGTAAAHFHAAVIEADLSCVPLIVCTADRPPHLRDVAAPQTIDQTKLYGDSVRWFHDPGLADSTFAHTWRSLAGRAHWAATGSRPGPVHLNLPFDEPLYGEPVDLPQERDSAWSSWSASSELHPSRLDELVPLMSGRQGMFVAGKGSPSNLTRLARALGWPVLADPRAGLDRSDPLVIDCFDPMLRVAPFSDRHHPDVVVHVGEHPASKVLAQWIGASGAELMQWSPFPRMVDPSHRTHIHLIGDLESVVEALIPRIEPARPHWGHSWSEAASRARSVVDDWVANHWSEIAVAHAVSRHSAPGAHLVVSSSMPIRDIEWFGSVGSGVSVHSNRGANGIDGVVSTAIGVALASAASTTLLIGDVAFLHDSAGLIGLGARSLDLKIVVTNNDGGSIFSFLPQAGLVDGAMFETLYGTPHGVDLAALSAAHGIGHRLVENHGQLISALESPGVLVVEARFDRSINVASHAAVNDVVQGALEDFRL